MGDLILIGVDHGSDDGTAKTAWRVNPDGTYTLVHCSYTPAKPWVAPPGCQF